MENILLKNPSISVHKPLQTPIKRLRNQLMDRSQKVIISKKPVCQWSVLTGISQGAGSWSCSHQHSLQPGCRYIPVDVTANVFVGESDKGQPFRALQWHSSLGSVEQCAFWRWAELLKMELHRWNIFCRYQWQDSGLYFSKQRPRNGFTVDSWLLMVSQTSQVAKMLK